MQEKFMMYGLRPSQPREELPKAPVYAFMKAARTPSKIDETKKQSSLVKSLKSKEEEEKVA